MSMLMSTCRLPQWQQLRLDVQRALLVPSQLTLSVATLPRGQHQHLCNNAACTMCWVHLCCCSSCASTNGEAQKPCIDSLPVTFFHALLFCMMWQKEHPVSLEQQDPNRICNLCNAADPWNCSRTPLWASAQSNIPSPPHDV